ncbi:hypothetical protein A1359_15730 [Methylomonas lenta]|jgi:hypothetical protein|uniref:Transmembrane anchor protein n=1 Tax=Methylomonas lenta TaxID=980561 RepID=A0A177MYL9_9GAMM|nr:MULTISPECIES: hypothetical protein [Methylomonas]MCK9607979.1 hypothetical protein [Methylomonas sp.]MDD2761488.1 hypothetical protein [Methylomonas sp.]OAI10711.1 hypothetical protein A1359_15730 [Methylomonas lenta]
MNDTKPPVQSLKSLTIASIFATLLAGLILITAILPAEYGIDPTGFGRMTGLTALSTQTTATSQSLTIACPAQNTAENLAQNGQQPPTTQWQDTVKIVVPAGEGLEYKFHLIKGAALEYSWATDGARLYFDFHGEPQGDKTGYFKSYKESTDNQSSGSLSAPFEGSHGWFWENKSSSPVTVVLNTKGSYRILGLM